MSVTRPPIPLTTLFTPPESCFNTITEVGDLFWQGSFNQIGDVECYPSAFRNILASYYTPGACPSGWSTAQLFTELPDPEETGAYCCPTDFTAFQTEIDSTSTINVCGSQLVGTYSNIYTTTTVNDVAMIPGAALQTLTIPASSEMYVFADIIQIRWHNTDSEVVALLASTVLSTSSALSTTTTLIPSSTPGSSSASVLSSASLTLSMGGLTPSSSTTPSDSQKSSSGISTGAKAGIGIGVGIAVLLVILAAVWIFGRLRRRQRTVEGTPLMPSSMPEKVWPQQYTYPQPQPQRQPTIAELDSYYTSGLGHQHPAELPAGHR